MPQPTPDKEAKFEVITHARLCSDFSTATHINGPCSVSFVSRPPGSHEAATSYYNVPAGKFLCLVKHQEGSICGTVGANSNRSKHLVLLHQLQQSTGVAAQKKGGWMLKQPTKLSATEIPGEPPVADGEPPPNSATPARAANDADGNPNVDQDQGVDRTDDAPARERSVVRFDQQPANDNAPSQQDMYAMMKAAMHEVFDERANPSPEENSFEPIPQSGPIAPKTKKRGRPATHTLVACGTFKCSQCGADLIAEYRPDTAKASVIDVNVLFDNVARPTYYCTADRQHPSHLATGVVEENEGSWLECRDDTDSLVNVCFRLHKGRQCARVFTHRFVLHVLRTYFTCLNLSKTVTLCEVYPAGKVVLGETPASTLTEDDIRRLILCACGEYEQDGSILKSYTASVIAEILKSFPGKLDGADVLYPEPERGIGIDSTYWAASRVTVLARGGKCRSLSTMATTIVSCSGAVLALELQSRSESSDNLEKALQAIDPHLTARITTVAIDRPRDFKNTIESYFESGKHQGPHHPGTKVSVKGDRFHLFRLFTRFLKVGHPKRAAFLSELTRIFKGMCGKDDQKIFTVEELQMALQKLHDKWSSDDSAVVSVPTSDATDAECIAAAQGTQAQVQVALESCQRHDAIISGKYKLNLQKLIQRPPEFWELFIGNEGQSTVGTNGNESVHAMMRKRMQCAATGVSLELWLVMAEIVKGTFNAAAACRQVKTGLSPGSVVNRQLHDHFKEASTLEFQRKLLRFPESRLRDECEYLVARNIRLATLMKFTEEVRATFRELVHDYVLKDPPLATPLHSYLSDHPEFRAYSHKVLQTELNRMVSAAYGNADVQRALQICCEQLKVLFCGLKKSVKKEVRGAKVAEKSDSSSSDSDSSDYEPEVEGQMDDTGNYLTHSRTCSWEDYKALRRSIRDLMKDYKDHPRVNSTFTRAAPHEIVRYLIVKDGCSADVLRSGVAVVYEYIAGPLVPGRSSEDSYRWLRICEMAEAAPWPSKPRFDPVESHTIVTVRRSRIMSLERMSISPLMVHPGEFDDDDLEAPEESPTV